VDKANYYTKLTELELIIDSSKDVVNQARKARAPDVKKKTVVVPKEKKVKWLVPRFQTPKSSKQPAAQPKSTQAIRPQPPVTNQPTS
jgi:hypothetical protein